MKSQEQEYFHYTSRQNLESILRCGQINPNTKDYDQPEHGITKMVWVSSMSPWEPICVATIELEPEGWEDLPEGIVPGEPYEAARIRVDSTVIEPWEPLLSSHGASGAEIFSLGQSGYEYNSDPNQWRAVLHAVKACFWQDVQLWDESNWVSLPRRGGLYHLDDLNTFISYPHHQGDYQ